MTEAEKRERRLAPMYPPTPYFRGTGYGTGLRDSGSGSQSEDPSGAEAEGPQSGGEAASPKSDSQ